MPNITVYESPQSEPAPDWLGLKRAVYAMPEYLEMLNRTPIAADLNSLLWEEQIDLARNHWQWLKENGFLPESLEHKIVSAAIEANLGEVFAELTNQQLSDR